MLSIVLPIFLVILVGYLFAKKNKFSKEAGKLINDYVLFIALPALLFLSVAQAKPVELLHWEFVVATLVGIFVAYMLGIVLSIFRSINAPKSSIVAMAACYGTTGYMGVPIVIAVFGEKAAIPAAIATILHNIPAIMAVIITYGIFNEEKKEGRSSISLFSTAIKITLLNPLTVAVIAGMFFSFLSIPLPNFLKTFTGFLSGAAGPTALFALGIGLSGLNVKSGMKINNLIDLSPIIIIKIIIQPFVTFLVAYYLFGMKFTDIYLIVAILMSAQPIGAGVYVFANKFDFFQEHIAVSIMVSLIVSIFSLSLLLEMMSDL
ncbi:MAG TPA: AEC family transporter [Leucothrix mucor]|uniref:AEC family transporter n=1 Tax=Leucothrix mucor TaxID=45248 RepID=A0A7V2T2R2_LEUMU|nr:AEC family transporter [Leucothrix mucor]